MLSRRVQQQLYLYLCHCIPVQNLLRTDSDTEFVSFVKLSHSRHVCNCHITHNVYSIYINNSAFRPEGKKVFARLSCSFTLSQGRLGQLGSLWYRTSGHQPDNEVSFPIVRKFETLYHAAEVIYQPRLSNSRNYTS